jgi:hypothetical protein
MPSLLGTQVAANYGRMVAQDTYATGADFSAFGTRPMKLLNITLSGGANNSMILQDGSTADASLTSALGFIPSLAGWKQPNSLFSRIIRVVQTFGEIYVVGQPNATDVLLLVSADTFNGAESGTTQNTQANTFGGLETAIAAEVAATNKADGTGTNSSSATVVVQSTKTSNFFVGAVVANLAAS